MLLSMSCWDCRSAYGYYVDDMGVSSGLVIAAVMATAVVFLVGWYLHDRFP